MLITAFNPSTDSLEKTYLSNNTKSGATELKVKNADRFNAEDRVLVGSMGHERSEIVTVTTKNDPETLVVTATEFSHSSNDPIYVLDYDEVKFYRSTTGVDGDYTVLATEPLDVDNADLKTKYRDTESANQYFYKVSFHHSIKEIETSLSDPIKATGYPRGTIGHIISSVLSLVGDPRQEVLTVNDYIDGANDLNEDLLNQAKTPYGFLKTEALLDVTEGDPTVDLPDNFYKLRPGEVEYTKQIGGIGSSYKLRKLEEQDFIRKNPSSLEIPTDDIAYYTLHESENKLILTPPPRTTQEGVLKIYYYKTFDEITSMADKVEPRNTLVYKYYFMWMFYDAKAASDRAFKIKADDYLNRYTTEQVKMHRSNKKDALPQEISPRHRSYFRRMY